MKQPRKAVTRCFWCNDADGEIVALGRSWAGTSAPLHVHPDHSARATHFVERTERLRLPFLGLFLAAVVLAPILAVVRSRYPETSGLALGAYLFFLGAWLIALPFATPQTVRWLGARAATRLVRVLGILILGAGAVIRLAAA
jgi:hypothetical protein